MCGGSLAVYCVDGGTNVLVRWVKLVEVDSSTIPSGFWALDGLFLGLLL